MSDRKPPPSSRPSLLVLQTGGHAYHLDAAHASARGIPVALGRRAFGPRAAVLELTFALAISALREIPAAHRSMTEGGWEPYLGRTLHGRSDVVLAGTATGRLSRDGSD